MEGGANVSRSVFRDMVHPSHGGKKGVELLLIRRKIGIERQKQLHHLICGYSTRT